MTLERKSPAYDLNFDNYVSGVIKIYALLLFKLWRQGKHQECRQANEYIKKPMSEINRYLKIWGMGW